MSTGGALGSELAKFAAGIEVQGMGDFAHSPPQLIEAILNKQFQDLQERGRDPTRALTHTRVLYARPTAPHLAPPPAQAAAEDEARACRKPLTMENITAVLTTPQRLALSMNQLTQFMLLHWHACFCYAELMRTLLLLGSYSVFCEHCFAVVILLGQQVTVLPSICAIFEAATFFKIDETVEGAIKFHDFMKTTQFQTQFPKTSTTWDFSHILHREVSVGDLILRLPPIPGLFDKG